MAARVKNSTEEQNEARKLASVNQAGGQCKTSSTINIGFHLAERGHKVLLVDLDGQASLTKQAGLDPRKLDKTIYDSLVKGEALPIHHNIHDMDWVPSNRNMYGLDIELSGKDKPNFRLKDALEKIKYDYDFILLDCPPSLGMASANALIAASHVLIPIATNEKGVEGVDELLYSIELAVKTGNPGLKSAGVIPTLFKKRQVVSETYLEDIRKFFKNHMPIYPPVPMRTEFEWAWAERNPLAKTAPKSEAIKVFQKIAEELEKLQ